MSSTQHFRKCSYITASNTPSPEQYNIRSTIGQNIAKSHTIGKGYSRDIFVEKLPFITPSSAEYSNMAYRTISPKVSIKVRYNHRSEQTPAPNQYFPKSVSTSRGIMLKQKTSVGVPQYYRSPGPCAYFVGLHEHLHSTGKSFKLGPNGDHANRDKPKRQIMFITHK